MPTLVAFDFDHTIVDCNSDTYIYNVLPDRMLPQRMRAMYMDGQWTAFMNQVFIHVSEQSVTKEHMRSVMKEMPMTTGMKVVCHAQRCRMEICTSPPLNRSQELLLHLRSRPDLYECIIVSDSNTFFIDWALEAHGLPDAFRRVITNQASWESVPSTSDAPGGDDSGRQRLCIRPYHTHTCPRCSLNLCKREAIEELLMEPPAAEGDVERATDRQRRGYDRVLYIGDGGNDFCPATMLSAGDAVFARSGYPLHKKLLSQKSEVSAEVVAWDSGFDILEWLRTRDS